MSDPPPTAFGATPENRCNKLFPYKCSAHGMYPPGKCPWSASGRDPVTGEHLARCEKIAGHDGECASMETAVM